MRRRPQIRKPRHHQRPLQRRHPRRRDRLAVHGRASAHRPRERPPHRRRLDHAHHRLAIDRQPDRHREHRKPVREVGRPVQRVHVPHAPGLLPPRAPHRPALFPNHGIPRKRRRQPRHHQRLGPLVPLGHQIDVFRLELKIGPRPPPLHQDRARVAADGRRHRPRVFQLVDGDGGGRRGHRVFRIQAASFDRASMYSAVDAIRGSTSLRSTTANPSRWPK